MGMLWEAVSSAHIIGNTNMNKWIVMRKKGNLQVDVLETQTMNLVLVVEVET